MAPGIESEATEAEAWRQARLQFLPWERTPADLDSPAQRALKQRLERHAGARIAASACIATDAPNISSWEKAVGSPATRWCAATSRFELNGDSRFRGNDAVDLQGCSKIQTPQYLAQF
jgi:hypothetical protein